MRNLQNEQAFIAQEIDKWAEHVADLVLEAIRKRKIKVSSALEKSIRGQAKNHIGELIFRQYGRFVDMGAGRGYQKGVEKISENRRRLTRTGRAPKKILFQNLLRYAQRSDARPIEYLQRKNYLRR